MAGYPQHDVPGNIPAPIAIDPRFSYVNGRQPNIPGLQYIDMANAFTNGLGFSESVPDHILEPQSNVAGQQYVDMGNQTRHQMPNEFAGETCYPQPIFLGQVLNPRFNVDDQRYLDMGNQMHYQMGNATVGVDDSWQPSMLGHIPDYRFGFSGQEHVSMYNNSQRFYDVPFLRESGVSGDVPEQPVIDPALLAIEPQPPKSQGSKTFSKAPAKKRRGRPPSNSPPIEGVTREMKLRLGLPGGGQESDNPAWI